ncbi:MAG: hypothetical protein B7X93_08970 [Hydrogenophilales bacterium 17-61-9]|nr:MAG: hypothetical protein B7X93_08970 [Hydrogenophilales bacterium 17-61-9]
MHRTHRKETRPMDQIQFTVKTTETEPLTLSRAVLIYEDHKRRAFATVHQCTVKGGKPVLLSGRAMTPAMSRSLSGKLNRKNIIGIGEFLPENVLMTDGDTLMWYEKPQVRHLAFKPSTIYPHRSLGLRGGPVPIPGTIFVAGPQNWSVFAVKGTERPTPSTPLYAAPFYNVDQNGGICQGNVTIPKSTAADRIGAWNDAFFRSYFPHANYSGVVDYEGDVTALWTDLLDGKFGKDFPEEVMCSYGLTLADLIRKRGEL